LKTSTEADELGFADADGFADHSNANKARAALSAHRLVRTRARIAILI
jgi:hypothetical protein